MFMRISRASSMMRWILFSLLKALEAKFWSIVFKVLVVQRQSLLHTLFSALRWAQMMHLTFVGTDALAQTRTWHLSLSSTSGGNVYLTLLLSQLKKSLEFLLSILIRLKIHSGSSLDSCWKICIHQSHQKFLILVLFLWSNPKAVFGCGLAVKFPRLISINIKK